jgi:Flp pilus assembly protein TadB
MRLVLLCGLALWGGTTLLLAHVRWFARRPLAQRIQPYAPGAAVPGASRSGAFSVASFGELVGPLAKRIGSRLAEAFGVDEDLQRRLDRVHAATDPTEFRIRQLATAGAGFFAGALLSAGLGLSPLLGLLFVLGLPLLGFLVPEQQLAARSERWQRDLFLELPVVAEQLGMLLSAGYSLGAALHRLALRGAGATGQDLRRVIGRVRQGLSEVDALREWAELVEVDAVERLVAVLALNREAGDLGRLIADEARTIRREVQRELIEVIERRGQQVWIPVTVATLVPGVLFLAVPFVEALQVFSNA